MHLGNVSGGVVSGDRLQACIEVGANSQAQITTTGSTRVYRTPAGDLPAQQELRAHIGEQASLEYIPDSVIPFAGSSYAQHATFELGNEAGLFCWEIFSPGRIGEHFQFSRFESHSAIWSRQEPIYLDCFSLTPPIAAFRSPIRFGSFTHSANFFICRTGLPASTWVGLEHDVSELARERNPQQETWGVSSLRRDGIILRGLARETEHLTSALIDFWRFLKNALYGRDPVLPRKLH